MSTFTATANIKKGIGSLHSSKLNEAAVKELVRDASDATIELTAHHVAEKHAKEYGCEFDVEYQTILYHLRKLREEANQARPA